MTIRILIADDHRMLREGLRALLGEYPDCEVIGEVANGRDAVARARELRPDVVVMDLGMKELNGVEATRRLRAENPDVRVVVLSTFEDEDYVLDALEAGAAAYVLKIGAHEELVEALRSVMQGRSYLSAGITGPVVRSALGDAVRHRARSGLTPREREVLQLVAEGRTSGEIAARLGLSTRTVEQHRRHLAEKLGTGGIADLTRYAIREGLVRIEE